MKRFVLTSALLGVILIAAAAAQSQKPNFAGTWTVVPESTGNGPVSAPFGGRKFMAAQNDKTLTITRAVEGAATQVPGYQTVFNLDGAESKNSTSIGGQAIEMAQGFDVERTDSWSLDPAGTLKVESQGRQGERPTSGAWSYKKD